MQIQLSGILYPNLTLMGKYDFLMVLSNYNNDLKMMNILDTIGNTPIVKLQRILPNGCGEIYIKFTMNISGHA